MSDKYLNEIIENLNECTTEEKITVLSILKKKNEEKGCTEKIMNINDILIHMSPVRLAKIEMILTMLESASEAAFEYIYKIIKTFSKSVK